MQEISCIIGCMLIGTKPNQGRGRMIGGRDKNSGVFVRVEGSCSFQRKATELSTR